MSSTFTSLASAIKTRFYLDKNTIPDLTYEESPAYALIPKSTDWGGNSAEFPIIYGQNPGGSSTFSNAQSNAGDLTMKRWSVPTSGNKKHYIFCQIPGDLIRAMEGSPNSYFPAVEQLVESSMKAAARDLSIDLFREGWGNIGVISAISTATITLATVGDAKNFEVGNVCVFSSSKNAAALRNSAGTLTVQSVDEDAGTVTFTASVSTLAAVTTGDYVFKVGNRQDSGSPSRLRIAGFESWVPFTRTGLSTSFFGVDRSLHPTRLAGSYLDASSKSLREGIQDMVSTLAGRKAKPDYAFVSFSTWNNLSKEMGSNVIYTDVKAGESGAVGFKSITINGPKGSVEVLPDQGCPDNRAFVIQRNTWKLLSLGKTIGFLDEDENRMLRQSSADSYEVRIGGYLDLICLAPGFNGVISFDGT